jgi:hypothetical protein
MQTLSPTISPTISKSAKLGSIDSEAIALSAIAESSVLQTAMAGLDATLNDELDRYRHWQANGQTISYLNPFRPRAVATQSIWTSPSLSEALSPIEPVSDRADYRTVQMPVMPSIESGLVRNSSALLISTSELNSYGLENLYNSESFTDQDLAQNGHGHGYDHEIQDNQDSLSSLTDDDILQKFANDYAGQYQESSEDELGYPIPSAPQEKNALSSLMNPVGIISLLLLLCSSAAIGYLIVDPSGVIKIFKPDARPKAAQVDEKSKGANTNSSNQQKESDAGLSFVPFAGDKANSANKNKTLVDPASQKLLPKSAISSNTTPNLFTPNSVFVRSNPLRITPSNTVPSNPALINTFPQNAALPSPLAPIENIDPPRANESAPKPKSAPVANPPMSRETVAPTSVAPRNNNDSVKYAAPITSAPVNSSYRVVVENSYAANAQQIERDAYIRPSDGQVQMGSYKDANSAQQKIEQLRRQGIPARID